jgi:hypothetical protein
VGDAGENVDGGTLQTQIAGWNTRLERSSAPNPVRWRGDTIIESAFRTPVRRFFAAKRHGPAHTAAARYQPRWSASAGKTRTRRVSGARPTVRRAPSAPNRMVLRVAAAAAGLSLGAMLLVGDRPVVRSVDELKAFTRAGPGHDSAHRVPEGGVRRT